MWTYHLLGQSFAIDYFSLGQKMLADVEGEVAQFDHDRLNVQEKWFVVMG